MDRQLLEKVFLSNNVPFFRYFKEVGSTNDVGIEWIGNDAPEYSVAIADSQTQGRGRNNRKWITTAGSSIAMSIIIYPKEHELEKLGLIPLLSGLAICDALNNAYEISAQVKWPNDILIAEKKTAGILVETVWEGEKIKGLVIGIGINLLADAVPKGEDLLFPATFIQDHTEDQVNPYLIIDHILQSIVSLREILPENSFINQYTEKLAFFNQPVVLHTSPKKEERGVIMGINNSGNLLLKTDDDRIRQFPIGDIKLRPE